MAASGEPYSVAARALDAAERRRRTRHRATLPARAQPASAAPAAAAPTAADPATDASPVAASAADRPDRGRAAADRKPAAESAAEAGSVTDPGHADRPGRSAGRGHRLRGQNADGAERQGRDPDPTPTSAATRMSASRAAVVAGPWAGSPGEPPGRSGNGPRPIPARPRSCASSSCTSSARASSSPPPGATSIDFGGCAAGAGRRPAVRRPVR